MNRSLIRGLYVITDAQLIPPDLLMRYAALAIEGGACVLQYRNKTGDHDQRQREAMGLSGLCQGHAVPFIMNDDVELAHIVSAKGVHLGRDDMALAQARRTLGAERIIGVSCYNTLDRAIEAQQAGADYVAFGSFFASLTKPSAARAEVDLLRRARACLQVPIVAIGGITPENAGILLEAGADALAVIHGVFGQPDPKAAAARYAELFRGRAAKTYPGPSRA